MKLFIFLLLGLFVHLIFTVTVEGCTFGDVRLVDGPTPNQGRLELCNNSQWGSVCDTYWEEYNSRVVCRQLGYDVAGSTFHSEAYYGQGTGNIWLDDAFCYGDELRLVDCYDIVSHNPSTSSCTHANDVGVQCSPNRTCTRGELRLVGGSNSREGRVEICIDGLWGTICDNDWDYLDAEVVCRQLGYQGKGSVAYNGGHFPSANGSIFIDLVDCKGTESRLLDCTYDDFAACSHNNDAGVYCPAFSSVEVEAIVTCSLVLGAILCTVCLLVSVAVCVMIKKKNKRYSRLRDQAARSSTVTVSCDACNLEQNQDIPPSYDENSVNLAGGVKIN